MLKRAPSFSSLFLHKPSRKTSLPDNLFANSVNKHTLNFKKSMSFNTPNTLTKGVFKNDFPNHSVSKNLDNSTRALCLAKNEPMPDILEQKNNTKCFVYYCTQELINFSVKKEGDNNLYHIDFNSEMVQNIHSKLIDHLKKNEIDMDMIKVLAKKESNEDYVVAARLILAIFHYDNKGSKLNFPFNADFNKSHMDGINFEKPVSLESSSEKTEHYQAVPADRLEASDPFLYKAIIRVQNNSNLDSFDSEINASKLQSNSGSLGTYYTDGIVDLGNVGTGPLSFYHSDSALVLPSALEYQGNKLNIKPNVHPDNLRYVTPLKQQLDKHIQENPDYKHEDEIRDTREKLILVLQAKSDNALKSTASSMKDTFSTPGKIQETKGGGEQKSAVLFLGPKDDSEIDYELTLVANMPIVRAHSKMGRVTLVRNLDENRIDCYLTTANGNKRLFHYVSY